MAEGAPLLREYRVYSPIEGSNPSLSATNPSNKGFMADFIFPSILKPIINISLYFWLQQMIYAKCRGTYIAQGVQEASFLEKMIHENGKAL